MILFKTVVWGFPNASLQDSDSSGVHKFTAH
jgi:hypothetical protein